MASTSSCCTVSQELCAFSERASRPCSCGPRRTSQDSPRRSREGTIGDELAHEAASGPQLLVEHGFSGEFKWDDALPIDTFALLPWHECILLQHEIESGWQSVPRTSAPRSAGPVSSWHKRLRGTKGCYKALAEFSDSCNGSRLRAASGTGHTCHTRRALLRCTCFLCTLNVAAVPVKEPKRDMVLVPEARVRGAAEVVSRQLSGHLFP